MKSLYTESSVPVVWRLFAAPDIPDGILEGRSPVGETLILPDGRSVSPVALAFPPSGRLSLNTVLPEPLPLLTRSILTGDCDVPEDCTVVLGISVDWNWDVFLNGELICDARPCRNGEHTFEPSDHLVRCRLKKGHNQIACEVFNGGDFFVGVKLFEDCGCALRWRPLVHFPDSSAAVTITFALDCIRPGGVRYRRTGASEWETAFDTLGGQIRRDTAVHNVRLTELEPDMAYEYQVFCLDEASGWGVVPLGGLEAFRTLPGCGAEFSFVASADAQNVAQRREWMTSLFRRDYAARASFFAYVGDVFWTSNFDQAVMDDFIAPFQEASGNRKLLEMVRGNHEYYGKDTQRYFDFFSVPENGKNGYGMFRCGDVCFIVLDFGDDCGPCPYPSTRALHCIEPYLKEQMRWLDRMTDEPMCRDARFRIVLAHGIPFGDWNAYMPGNIRRVIDPFFAGANPRCPIHLWMGGHVHYPLRSIPGSNAFRSISAPKPPVLPEAYCGDRYHFPIVIFSGPRASNPPELQLSDVEVRVSPDALTVISHDLNGAEFDRISVSPDRRVTEIASAEFFARMELP